MAAARLPYRVFHHVMDGINDISSGRKADALLRQHGCPGEKASTLVGGRRRLLNHHWQDAYSGPVLAFFARQIGRSGP